MPELGDIKGERQSYVSHLKSNLSFDDQVASVRKCCSQRTFILKLFREQGMSQKHLDNVFHYVQDSVCFVCTERLHSTTKSGNATQSY